MKFGFHEESFILAEKTQSAGIANSLTGDTLCDIFEKTHQMKQILIIIIYLFINICVGQNFEETLPKKYHKVIETKGDLDNDGIDEIVYVYDTDKEVEELGFERELYICKVIDDKIKLWKKNKSILWKSKDGGFYSENGIEMSIEILNNTLILKQTFQSNSRHSQTYKNIFRYQNNDWYLIGSNCTHDDNCEFNFAYDINFSTKKVIVSEKYHNCEDNQKQTQKNYYKTFKYDFKETPKMDNFVAGKKEINIPKTRKYFYY